MLNRTSDLTVNSYMHPRHGLLGISVLRLTAAFLQLVGNQKSATCNITRSACDGQQLPPDQDARRGKAL